MLPGWHVTSVPLVSVRFGWVRGDVYETRCSGRSVGDAEGMADVHRALRAS